jgi:hypothetical protein
MNDLQYANVPLMFDKLEGAIKIGKDSPDLDWPESINDLCERLQKKNTDLPRKLYPGRFSEVKNGERKFTIREHKAILREFGVNWPEPTYYDLTGLKQDSNVEKFLRAACRGSGKIELELVPTNERNLAQTEAFVLDMHDVSKQTAFEGEIWISPNDQDVEPEAGSAHAGRAIGVVGFAAVLVHIEYTSGVTIAHAPASKAPVELTPPIEISNRSSQSFIGWTVRARATDTGQIQLLKGDIPVGQILISEIGDDDRVVVVATTTAPSFKINEGIAPDLEQAQLQKYEAIAQAKLAKTFSLSAEHEDRLMLGKLSFRSTNTPLTKPETKDD